MSEALHAKIAALRGPAYKASGHPLLSHDARLAIAGLVGIIETMATEIDWLRRDLTELSTYRRGPTRPTSGGH